MGSQGVEKKVTAFLAPIVEERQYELVDVEYVKEGPNWYVRAYIDKEGGVTIDDCEFVSRALEQKLDENDPISQAYILEVSSPGVDRPLKKESDFERYKGEIVDIKLYKSINKKKEFQGELQGLKDQQVSILDENGETLSFAREDIAMVRLAVIF